MHINTDPCEINIILFFSVLDSVGKPASGILEGGVFFIGFYSECVTSVVNISRTEKISGQYCLINFNFSSSAPKVSCEK